MKSKEYKQFGTFSVAIFVPILLASVVYLFKTGISADSESIGLQVLILVLIACLLTFYKLTIYIDETAISFKFGIGWFGKRYKFQEIGSCKPVKNQWKYGIGIRWTGFGWLYNVSGGKAIELRLKNKKSVVRIGTNKPQEISEVLRKEIAFTT